MVEVFKRRWKHLVFLGTEIRFCSQYNCQLISGKTAYEIAPNPNVFQAWTLQQQT